MLNDRFSATFESFQKKEYGREKNCQYTRFIRFRLRASSIRRDVATT